LASVTKLTTGIGTGVLSKRGKKDKAECYFSLILPDRSLDLEFATEEDQSVFHSCMRKLVDIEHEVRASEHHKAPVFSGAARRLEMLSDGSPSAALMWPEHDRYASSRTQGETRA
jgi:hypothetical protein